MKRWTGFVLILVSYGMALLHTAIPHSHNSVSRQGYVISSTHCQFSHSTTGDLLQLVFSTDLGYGHLEVFNKSADTPTDVQPALAGVLPAPITVATPEYHISRYRAGFLEKLQVRLLIFSTAQFRAPPALV